MDYKEQTAALNLIPIRDIASWFGKNLPERGAALCPFPDHPEKNKSFEIKKDGVRWQCYACNRSGGSIDFVSVYLGFDFITAKRWLASKAGLAPNQAIPRSVPKKRNVTSQEAQPAERIDFEVYEAFLEMCPLGQSGFDYLGGRGLSAGLLERFRIGQISSATVLAKELVRKFDVDRLIESGLITSRSTSTNVRLTMPNQTIVIPFIEREKVSYFQGRALGEVKTGQKWFNLPRGGPAISTMFQPE
nr:CHC2 zinc finger domain-containing protein [uncultured Cohaesibacter sp.]